MNYAVKWHPQAFKVIKRMPKTVIQRVLDKLDWTAKDPFRFLEHFEGNKLYKIRIGNYRALIELKINEKLLLVKVFDHRSKVYKK